MARSAATLVLVLLAACKDERAAVPASPPGVAPAVVHDALPIDTAVDDLQRIGHDKLLAWACWELGLSPILVVLADGRVRVLGGSMGRATNDRHPDLVFAAAESAQARAAFRELLERHGLLGWNRPKQYEKPLPNWPYIEPPTPELNDADRAVVARFTPATLLRELVRRGVLSQAIWPDNYKLRVVTAKIERELSLVDYEAKPVTLEAELAR